MGYCDIKCPKGFPQRTWVMILCFIGLTISYMMRFSFNVAIVNMAEQKVIHNEKLCKQVWGANKSANRTFEFDWDSPTQGKIKSSFFYGYIITQVPGGMLAERIGGKNVLTMGVFFTSIITLLTPIVTRKFDWIGLMVARIGVGLVQGFVYSSLHVMVANWVPVHERGFYGALVFSGAHFGNMLSTLCTGLLIFHFNDWTLPFYVYGAVALFWTFLFFLTTSNVPQEQKYLHEGEKEMLDAYKIESQKMDKMTWPPCKHIFTSIPVYAILVAMIGHDWALFTLVVDIPKFMDAVLNFDIKQNGMYLAGGYLGIWLFCLISGLITDCMIRRKWITVTWARKLSTIIATVGPGLGMIGASYSGCNHGLAVASLIFGMSFMGFFYSSLKVNPIDLSPNFAGTLGSMGHCVGALSGIAVPHIIAAMTPNNTQGEWLGFFWLTFGVLMATNVFYAIFASAETQPWNNLAANEPKAP